jgi:manganese transport system substrate-binding protein
MTSWRRTRLVLATIVTAAILTACGVGTDTSDESARDKPVVLTTFTVLADIAQNVAGEHLTVESITKPGAEIHDYEPTPGDIRTASDAVLVLDNGLGLERWFEQFIHDADVPHVVVSEGVTPIDISEDAYAGKPNPHAWMSPNNVQIYVDNMVSAFVELDPAHADDYERNGEAYKQQLQEVEDTLADELAELPQNHRALITCEGAFSYLARDAGLTEQYLWAVNADEEGTPQQIAKVTDFVIENDVPAVFCESTVSAKPMQQVVEATGAVLGDTLYVDSLSDADGPVPTYLDLIRHDVEAITAGLSGATS